MSHLPITKFVYDATLGAYDPDRFVPSDSDKIIASEDDWASGFRAVAVEHDSGSQKITLIAIAGTDPFSGADIIAERQLGRELLLQAGVGKDARLIPLEPRYNQLDYEIDHAINFYQKVQGITNAPIIVAGHSLGRSNRYPKREIPRSRNHV